MRVLNPADGFPELPGCRVGLIRNPHESLALADALAEHIISSLDNLSEGARRRRSRRARSDLRRLNWRCAQYAYSSKIGSTEPFHGPWYFSSSSSAGVMPRATISCSGRR